MMRNFYSNAKKNNYIKESLEKSLAKYGNIQYVYAVINKKNTDDMLIISDLPESLVKNYQTNRIQNIDPVVINALNRISYFPWTDDLMINSQWQVKKVFAPFKSHNIMSGHIFVLHDYNNQLAMLVLYIDRFLMAEVDEAIKRHRDELQGLLIFTHEMLLKIYQEENQVDKKGLSSREAEILYWSSTGKTYVEVAGTLNIAVSTVKFHMANIVKKMGVRNAKHAISLGIELNMITPPTFNK